MTGALGRKKSEVRGAVCHECWKETVFKQRIRIVHLNWRFFPSYLGKYFLCVSVALAHNAVGEPVSGACSEPAARLSITRSVS